MCDARLIVDLSEIVRYIASPEGQNKLINEMGLIPGAPTSPDELAKFVAKEVEDWGKLVRLADPPALWYLAKARAIAVDAGQARHDGREKNAPSQPSRAACHQSYGAPRCRGALISSRSSSCSSAWRTLS